MIEIGNIYSDDWFGKNISLSVSFFLNEEIILYDNPLRVFFLKAFNQILDLYQRSWFNSCGVGSFLKTQDNYEWWYSCQLLMTIVTCGYESFDKN